MGGARETGRPGPVAGIVAEYNPFHKGHAWMVHTLKQRGFSAVVCVMSGPFVQRAEPALLPTHIRARAAVAGGVDLVLRLPVPWAAASAEGFARGGVGLLAALGCVDVLAFGAETEDTQRLWQVAQVLENPAFSHLLQRQLKTGASFAAARAAAAEEALPGAASILATSNNILGVEYYKALQRGWGPGIPLPRPQALPRQGAVHDGSPTGGYASASWLRGLAETEGMDVLKDYVPAACLPFYKKAEEAGEVLDPNRWALAFLARLRGLSAEDFARHPGAGEGLEARLAKAAGQAVNLEELYALAKSKRFAHSRVRRLALGTALDLPAALPGLPPFLHLLAASEKGLALLKKARRTAHLPLGTSLAKLSRTSAEAATAARLESAAEDLHALCLHTPMPGGGVYTRPLQVVQSGKEPAE